MECTNVRETVGKATRNKFLGQTEELGAGEVVKSGTIAILSLSFLSQARDCQVPRSAEWIAALILQQRQRRPRLKNRSSVDVIIILFLVGLVAGIRSLSDRAFVYDE